MVPTVINTSDLTDTRTIVERLYSDDAKRKKLLNKAATFFHSRDTRLGLDAESLLHEAIAIVLQRRFPPDTDNHLAYLMRTIERQGIQRVHRRKRTDQAPKTVVAKAKLVPVDPSFGVEETVINRLERDIMTEAVRSALEGLPPKVRRVAMAKVEYPDHSDTAIAGVLGVSRSTVMRAKRLMREDPTLRQLIREATRGDHNGNQPPPDRRRTP